MFRITLVTNAIHLEAARRALLWQEERGRVRSRWLDLLVHEPRRLRLTAADRQRWPLRLPVHPLVMAALVVPGRLGLVEELRLAHLRGAGRALRLLARLARRHSLLDDGLDQYRERPRAVDPSSFPVGIECWLFSDAPAWRASWCARFRCRELGPLYGQLPIALPETGAPGGALHAGTLIIDSPGVERLQAQAGKLPRPWCLVPHPVVAKRSWVLPLAEDDACLRVHPEELLPTWQGTVLVGESLMLLAALRLRPPGTWLIAALPEEADGQLRALLASAALSDPFVTVAG